LIIAYIDNGIRDRKLIGESFFSFTTHAAEFIGDDIYSGGYYYRL
jgi:hypothetical protein